VVVVAGLSDCETLADDGSVDQHLVVTAAEFAAEAVAVAGSGNGPNATVADSKAQNVAVIEQVVVAEVELAAVVEFAAVVE
jgi:hypothetical protein